MIALFSSEYCSPVGATAGKNEELTITEALRDPLIAIVMRADGVTSEEFKRLLEAAARELKANLANSIHGSGKEQATRTPAPSHQDRRRDCRNDTGDG
ncbi:hypothetical protein HFO39_21205 [Rhizobium leguminosarum]|uniref:hypothetical protein n=1 Tax=Rhizobium leguminosarum TaxID=384 RepID=UPI001C908318|nr:hypothetical protein [Rhizobium leguminosarum]MBY5521648.1 hypothetical protein [Rhizobium leguminosarum]MBY5549193.1 hypothetical protein [Rhizobium leguminosarum]MBY5561600.1 hypothetical protein [Rhizobium leguminosarum]MBY5621033.1 hypothetical protein [Rhizobium leguminosarum]